MIRQLALKSASVLSVGNDKINEVYQAKKVGFQTVLLAGNSRFQKLRKDGTQCNSLSQDFVIKDLIQLADREVHGVLIPEIFL